MKSLKTYLEKIFSAAAFAEADDAATARTIMGREPASPAAERVPSFLENLYAAVAFAEAGCHAEALQVLGTRKPAKAPRPMVDFLDTVGLRGARITYVVATV